MKGDVKDTRGGIKTIIVKQDETIKEIRDLRFDLRGYMDQRFQRLESDVRVIKERMGIS
jgi:hypothetical protein